MLFGQVKAILRLRKRISNAEHIAFLAPGGKFFCEMTLNLQKRERNVYTGVYTTTTIIFCQKNLDICCRSENTHPLTHLCYYYFCVTIAFSP